MASGRSYCDELQDIDWSMTTPNQPQRRSPQSLVEQIDWGRRAPCPGAEAQPSESDFSDFDPCQPDRRLAPAPRSVSPRTRAAQQLQRAQATTFPSQPQYPSMAGPCGEGYQNYPQQAQLYRTKPAPTSTGVRTQALVEDLDPCVTPDMPASYRSRPLPCPGRTLSPPRSPRDMGLRSSLYKHQQTPDPLGKTAAALERFRKKQKYGRIIPAKPSPPPAPAPCPDQEMPLALGRPQIPKQWVPPRPLLKPNLPQRKVHFSPPKPRPPSFLERYRSATTSTYIDDVVARCAAAMEPPAAARPAPTDGGLRSCLYKYQRPPDPQAAEALERFRKKQMYGRVSSPKPSPSPKSAFGPAPRFELDFDESSVGQPAEADGEMACEIQEAIQNSLKDMQPIKARKTACASQLMQRTPVGTPEPTETMTSTTEVKERIGRKLHAEVQSILKNHGIEERRGGTAAGGGPSGSPQPSGSRWEDPGPAGDACETQDPCAVPAPRGPQARRPLHAPRVRPAPAVELPEKRAKYGSELRAEIHQRPAQKPGPQQAQTAEALERFRKKQAYGRVRTPPPCQPAAPPCQPAAPPCQPAAPPCQPARAPSPRRATPRQDPRQAASAEALERFRKKQAYGRVRSPTPCQPAAPPCQPAAPPCQPAAPPCPPAASSPCEGARALSPRRPPSVCREPAPQEGKTAEALERFRKKQAYGRVRTPSPCPPAAPPCPPAAPPCQPAAPPCQPAAPPPQARAPSPRRPPSVCREPTPQEGKTTEALERFRKKQAYGRVRTPSPCPPAASPCPPAASPCPPAAPPCQPAREASRAPTPRRPTPCREPDPQQAASAEALERFRKKQAYGRVSSPGPCPPPAAPVPRVAAPSPATTEALERFRKKQAYGRVSSPGPCPPPAAPVAPRAMAPPAATTEALERFRKKQAYGRVQSARPCPPAAQPGPSQSQAAPRAQQQAPICPPARTPAVARPQMGIPRPPTQRPSTSSTPAHPPSTASRMTRLPTPKPSTSSACLPRGQPKPSPCPSPSGDASPARRRPLHVPAPRANVQPATMASERNRYESGLRGSLYERPQRPTSATKLPRRTPQSPC